MLMNSLKKTAGPKKNDSRSFGPDINSNRQKKCGTVLHLNITAAVMPPGNLRDQKVFYKLSKSSLIILPKMCNAMAMLQTKMYVM